MATLGSISEGSVIKLKENGALVEFYVAKHNYESGLNGSGRTLVVRKDCYSMGGTWQNSTNAYAGSEMDSLLNGTYKNLLDSDIRTAMGTTKFYYTPGNGNDTKTTLSRSVFVLSATEMGGSHAFMNAEGTALSGAVINLLKVAKWNGTAVICWTRSPVTGSTNRAWVLNSSGNSDTYTSTSAYGVRPVFTLPSSLLVSNNGPVYANTAPSTPSSISVPSSISGGSTITVSWGSSSDTEGNLAGYIVERSTNGGSSWSQIYQGGSTSTTNYVAFGTASVMYRVKAYDTEGLNSGWRTGGSVTVINNQAPGAPGSINVPLDVTGGAELTVTWEAATDQDGNLAGYSLEREVDGGGQWSVVYTGNTLSYTDTITKGWASVKYRVRAYDTNNAYSGYVTSDICTVDNNMAPTIACDSASGSDLGIKTEGFSVQYSVADEDADEVTVAEVLDRESLRTFSAGLEEDSNLQITGETFLRLLNGTHTLTITANDGKANTVHTLTFKKEVTEAAITLEEPMEADADITICVLSVIGSIPADAEYSVKVTNNANDATPVWEDCTTEVKVGANHVFTNTTATNGPAFNFKVEAKRGTSGIGGYINSVQGEFQ